MKAARDHDLDPHLVNAVIWVESRFDPNARSPAGARGLMQLMPATASALAREIGWVRPRSTDPEFNVTAGAHYLSKLIVRYDGDERLGLAAYNAGPGNVDKWLANGGLPPFSERYVDLVMDARARFATLHEDTHGDTYVAQNDVKPSSASREFDEPRPVVPEPPSSPPAYEPEFPVRFDLDRVESTYVPTLASEPPLVDTPWPREIPSAVSGPEPAMAPDEPPPTRDEDLPMGDRDLPSVIEAP